MLEFVLLCIIVLLIIGLVGSIFIPRPDFNCPKTAYGYNCKHRVYTDGTKECGEWRSEEDREQWSL